MIQEPRSPSSSTLLSVAVVAFCSLLCGCGIMAEPGRASVKFVWSEEPEGPVWIWVRVEDRSPSSTERRTLSTAGPDQWSPGTGLSMELAGIPNGTHRVVVAEVREGKDEELPIRFYGVSNEFTLKPGADVDVEVELGLIQPLVLLPEQQSPVVILVDGERKDFIRSEDLDRTLVQTLSRGATRILLANDVSFGGQVQEVDVDRSNGGSCQVLKRKGADWDLCLTPWDLRAEIVDGLQQAPDGRYFVHARFFDTEGYPTEIQSDSVELDTQAPILLGTPVFQRTDGYEPASVQSNVVHARAGTTVDVRFVVSEPVGMAPIVLLHEAEVVAAPLSGEEKIFQAFVEDPGIEGSAAVLASLSDRAGNPATLELGWIHYDYQEPARLYGKSQSQVRLFRAPWGCDESDGEPRIELRACPVPQGIQEPWDWCSRGGVPPIEPGATVTVFATEGTEEGPPVCAEKVIGTGTADPETGSVRLELFGDRPSVCISMTDLAGNISIPSLVKTGEWVATFGQKIPGSTTENPHHLWTTSQRAPAPEALDAMSLPTHEQVQALAVTDGDPFFFSQPLGQWNPVQIGAASPPPRNKAEMVYDERRGQIVLFGGGIGQESYGDTWLWNGDRWKEVETGGLSPPARRDFAMAYDALRGRVVLFGGRQSYPGGWTLLDDTWEWDGESWIDVTPATQSPPPQQGHAMAFDRREGVVVLYGLDDWSASTWQWDGKNWELVAGDCGYYPSLNCPGALDGPRMVYDSCRGKLLLFGGNVDTVPQQGLWEWDGGTWLEVAMSGDVVPAARSYHSLVFAPPLCRVMLFGGDLDADCWIHPGASSNIVWEWDDNGWKQITASGDLPQPRCGHAAAFDSARGEAVIFSGAGEWDDFNDTWGWDGRRWIDMTQTGDAPTSRQGYAQTYDSRSGRTVLFGGRDDEGYELSDTWAWNGFQWKELKNVSILREPPNERDGASLAHHLERGTNVLFGGRLGSGQFLSDTWEWDGLDWCLLSSVSSDPDGPSQREGAGLFYDSNLGSVVLHGGYSWAGLLGDTWRWGGDAWELIEGEVPEKLHLVGHMTAYDSLRSRGVLFGGCRAATNQQEGLDCDETTNTTFEWNGAEWEHKGGPFSTTPEYNIWPEARIGHGMAFDASRGHTILFGGSWGGSDDGILSDLWEWDGTAWSEVGATGASPAGSEWQAMSFDTGRSRLVLTGPGGAGSEGQLQVWELVSPGDQFPALVAGFDLAQSGGTDWSMRRIEVRAVAGGRGCPGETGSLEGNEPCVEGTAGVELALWDSRFGRWRSVAESQAPTAAPEELLYVVGARGPIARNTGGGLHRVDAMIRPPGPNGTGTDAAQVAVDSIEVRMVYRIEDQCVPDCASCECGGDGCGGSCGGCAREAERCVGGVCVCTPDCWDRECGPDRCGGSCGTCPEGSVCLGSGRCCTPDCQGRICGTDGCGGSCGTCGPTGRCNVLGECVDPCKGIAQQNCCHGEIAVVCIVEEGTIYGERLDCEEAGMPHCGWYPLQYGGGLYLCGTSGGSDPSGAWPKECGACMPDCDGKECGTNGCDGLCGYCPFGEVCQEGLCTELVCVPDCADAVECGGDGCGGSCGECQPGEACLNGSCVTTGESCEDGNALSFDGCTDGVISEFQIAVTETTGMATPQLATFSDGDYAIVWSDLWETVAWFAEDGTALGAPVDLPGVYADIAPLADGDVVVVWHHWDVGGDEELGVFGRILDAGGVDASETFHVNTYVTGEQSRPAVTALPDGRFVVAWQSGAPGGTDTQDGSGAGLYLRVFHPDGTPDGPEIPVPGETAGDQEQVVLAGLADGTYVAAWRSSNTTEPADKVLVRPFYQYGPSGDELAVAQAQTGAPQRPRVASLAGGGFVVGWLDDFFDVQIQRFDDLAMSLGEPTSVCPEGAFWVHADLAIAGLQSGGFVVVWQAISAWDEEQDFDIWVRVYGDDGSPATDPEVVNVQAQGEQRYPDVASFPGGGFIVAWKSEAEGEGVSPGIFVQRYTESGEKVYH